MGKGKTSSAAQTAFDRLSPKHRVFVTEFMKDFNATQAYIRAGYSPNGADAGAARILTYPNIKAAIEELLDKQGITANRIQICVAGIAFGNEPSKIVSDAGVVRREQDKLAALDRLMKIRGMVTKKSEVSHAGKIVVPFIDDDELDARLKAKREGKS